MNSNKVLRLVKLVIIMLIIVAVIIVINAVIKNSKTSLETADIKSNMLQIQAKGRVLNDKADMNNKIEEERKGNRLSSFKTEEEKKKEAEEAAKKAAEENGENGENAAPVEVPQQEVKKDEKEDPNKEKTLDEIVNDFKKLNIIPESDYDKYYALEDADLEFFGLNFKNEKNARYLINYDTHEVGITCGYQGQYLLSQMGLKD
jgi:flagellar biosynthesis GTPase FlhF